LCHADAAPRAFRRGRPVDDNDPIVRRFRHLVASLGLSLWALASRVPQVSAIHVRMYRLLGGRLVDRVTLGGRAGLLTTTGRRSGRPRSVVLGLFRCGGELVVAGSNGGLDREPAWVLNLRADPHAELQVGRDRHRFVAQFLEGDEWQDCWDQLAEAHPAYEQARRRSHRAIPLVRLLGEPDQAGSSRLSD
jgi:deazaflavin-dependent oxidoreductase (nitroreductase family)